MRQCIMQWVLIVELFIFSTNLVAIEIDSVQIDANQQWLELTLLLQHSTISRHSKDEVTLDTRDCESKKPPMPACTWGLGRYVLHQSRPRKSDLRSPQEHALLSQDFEQPIG